MSKLIDKVNAMLNGNLIINLTQYEIERYCVTYHKYWDSGIIAKQFINSKCDFNSVLKKTVGDYKGDGYFRNSYFLINSNLDENIRIGGKKFNISELPIETHFIFRPKDLECAIDSLLHKFWDLYVNEHFLYIIKKVTSSYSTSDYTCGDLTFCYSIIRGNE